MVVDVPLPVFIAESVGNCNAIQVGKRLQERNELRRGDAFGLDGVPVTELRLQDLELCVSIADPTEDYNNRAAEAIGAELGEH